MRDLNLGPDTRELVRRYQNIKVENAQQLREHADNMSRMLERWIDIAWCWVDAAPATICGGPHVKIVIQDREEVIVTARQADRINASGDTATYRWTRGHLMDVIKEQ